MLINEFLKHAKSFLKQNYNLNKNKVMLITIESNLIMIQDSTYFIFQNVNE